MRLLQLSLKSLSQTQEILEHLKHSIKAPHEKVKEEGVAGGSGDTLCDPSGTVKQLLEILIQRLQCVLKQLLNTLVKKG